MPTSDEVVLAVDLGTSGARAIAFDAVAGVRIGEERSPYETDLPRPGWVEQNADDWVACAFAAVARLVRRLEISSRVVSLAVTGQCPTVVPVDRRGRPLRPALLYSDNRATAEAAFFEERIGGDHIHEVTGHFPAAFNIGPKLLWLARHERETFRRSDLFLQPRDYVVRALTGEVYTDGTHAPATLLFDLKKRAWSLEILEAVGLPASSLPPVLASSTVIGVVARDVSAELGLSDDVRVILGAADSQACALGMGVIHKGPLSEMAGSSTCLNSITHEVVADRRISHYLDATGAALTTETGINASGAAFDWIVRTCYAGSVTSAAAPDYARAEADAERAAASLEGVFAFPGLADGDRDAPGARGAIVGLSRTDSRGTLTRAILEGIAFTIRTQIDILRSAGVNVTELRVSGGAARVGLWNRVKADILGMPVIAVGEDAAARGIAMLAAVGGGLVADFETAVSDWVRLPAPVVPDDDTTLAMQSAYSTFCALQERVRQVGCDPLPPLAAGGRDRS
jgi:xylulokinase